MADSKLLTDGPALMNEPLTTTDSQPLTHPHPAPPDPDPSRPNPPFSIMAEPTPAGALLGAVSSHALASAALYQRRPAEQPGADNAPPADGADLSIRFRLEYPPLDAIPATILRRAKPGPHPRANPPPGSDAGSEPSAEHRLQRGKPPPAETAHGGGGALVRRVTPAAAAAAGPRPDSTSTALTTSAHAILSLKQSKPKWHPPWKLMRVISGHLGWVRALAVEPGNQWFASGAGDRTIKIWDLATGSLRLTLTGHISTVRGLAISSRHPYLFSCGEDKMVKCWDLETNKVIRHYHGHLSGVYTLDLHPTLDVLATGGRDGVVRVWDMRSRSNIIVLSGHTGTVAEVKCQEADPQIISASLDSTVRLYDLTAAKSMAVLTHHKKGVRALTVHPEEFTFASASSGSIKQWKCPEGAFMQNFDGHNSIINTLSVNSSGVLFSGGDDGSMSFWDWVSSYRFQERDTIAQPGSLDAETGIMSSTFDLTGTRLICGEADKTIKIWKEDTGATEESNPMDWTPTLQRRNY